MDMFEAIHLVEEELVRASGRHGGFSSVHEGLGVITEEYHELIEAVRSNDPAKIREEATQLAAMATRMLMDT